jgi:creatinine amidohydrolase
MHDLERMTMTEFSEICGRTKTIVFPFGTIEEHGTHLPLNTDSFIIQECVTAAAKEREFVRAPVISYGVCTTTKNHPGTLSISAATLRRLSADLVTEAYRQGLKNFLLISGHGGSLHMAALKETAENLVDTLSGIRIAAFSPYDMLWKELSEIADTPNDSHAGEIETSILLYLDPDSVRGRSPEEFPSFPKPFSVKDKLKYWPGGIWGNPEKASPEKGRRAFELMTRKILDVLDMIE